MSRLGRALIAPLLLALSLGALASGVDTYEFRHPERQTRAQGIGPRPALSPVPEPEPGGVQLPPSPGICGSRSIAGWTRDRAMSR